MEKTLNEIIGERLAPFSEKEEAHLVMAGFLDLADALAFPLSHPVDYMRCALAYIENERKRAKIRSETKTERYFPDYQI